MRKTLLLVLVSLFISGMIAVLSEDMPVIEWYERATSSPTPVPTPASESVTDTARTILSLNVGDTFEFGHYEQDNDLNNGAEPIEWIVLGTEGDTVTIISKYGLDAKPYNEAYIFVTWESCTLRQWLNGDFLNAAFTAQEQSKLHTVNVTADVNPEYITDPGNDTQNRVYLLSIAEANKLFDSNDVRKCQATAYAKAQGAYVADNGNGRWWLRSPGSTSDCAAYVSHDGYVYISGYDGAVYDNYAVRPVICLRLS